MTGLYRAYACMARGAYEAALPHFETALGEDPDNATAHAKLSLCLASLNRRYGAMKEAERALQLAPEASGSHVAYAFALMLMNDGVEARRSLDRAMALDPHNPDALTMRCALALRERKPKALRQAAEELLAQHPYDADAKGYLSRAASLEGDGAQGERLAREALGDNPEDANNHIAIGWAFLAQGKAAKAKDAALNALMIASSHRGAMELLAFSKLRAAPLTGWVHWFNIKLMLMSETGQAMVLVAFLSVNFLGDDILDHYGLSAGSGALNIAIWGFILMTVVSHLAVTNALKRDLAQVRLRTSY